MPDQPYTDAELEDGARAVGKSRHFIDTDGYPSIRIGSVEDEARVVLEAVLPLHAARIRREVADEIAAAIAPHGRLSPAAQRAYRAREAVREAVRAGVSTDGTA